MVQWPNLERYLRHRFAPAAKELANPMRFAWIALPSWVVLKRVIPPDGPGGLWLAHALPLAFVAGLFIWSRVKVRKFVNFAQRSPYPFEVIESLGKLSCHAIENELDKSVDRRFGDQWELAITAFRSIRESMSSPQIENLNAEYPGLEINSRILRMADGACIECLMAGRTFVREIDEKPKDFTKRMVAAGMGQGEIERVKAYVQAIQTYAGKLHDVGRQDEPLRTIEEAFTYLESFRRDQARAGAYHFPII